MDEYRAVLRLNPSERDARYNLANALKAKGDLVSARKEYKKALKLIPKTPENQPKIKSIKSVLSELAGAMRQIVPCDVVLLSQWALLATGR